MFRILPHARRALQQLSANLKRLTKRKGEDSQLFWLQTGDDHSHTYFTPHLTLPPSISLSRMTCV